MATTPLGLFPASGAVSRTAGAGRVSGTERRRRPRTKVHWPVRFLRANAEAIDGVTQDLSSNGFYCLLRSAFARDELVECALKVPAHDPQSTGRTLRLDCTVRIVRAEPASEGLFGIACRIEAYRLAPGGAGLG